MGEISAGTLTFRRKQVPGDDTCLFWSFLSGIKQKWEGMFNNTSCDKIFMDILNENLRAEVARYIRCNPEMHSMVLHCGTEYTDVEEYCLAIERGKLWGGDPEFKALSDLYNIIICVIDPTKTTKNKCLLPSYYGQDNPSATECLYILYNGINHYDPLYLGNTENLDEIETIFDPNDPIVNDLLKKFITEELHHDGDVELGVSVSVGAPVSERPRPMDDSNIIETVDDLVHLNPSMKRKESNVEGISMSSDDNKQLPVLISNEYFDSNKRRKVAEEAADWTSPFNENNSETMITASRIQPNNVRDESGVRDIQGNQEKTTDSSMAWNDEHQKEPVNHTEGGIQDNDKLQNNNEPTVPGSLA